MLIWIVRNTILIRQRDTSDFFIVDNMALLQIATIFLIFGLFFILYRKISIRTLNNIYKSPALWFFLLYTFGLISAFWSPFFGYSAYRAFEGLVLFFAIFVYFNSRSDFAKSEIKFLRFILILLLLTFVGQLKLNDFSLSIVTLHTNTYSFIALILFLYSVGELISKSEKTKKRKKMLKKYAWIGLFFVALGTSAATNVATVIALIVLAFITDRNYFKIGFIIFLLISIPLYVIIGDMVTIQEILFPGKNIESIANMTGRMNLWERYIDKIYERPFTGWGFAVMARISEHATTNTHNSILSILSGMGVVGGLLLLKFSMHSMMSFFINRKRKIIGNIGCGIALFGSLVNAMSIAVIGESVSSATFSFVALIAFYYLSVAGNSISLYGQKVR
jgi:O-antigen ligase